MVDPETNWEVCIMKVRLFLMKNAWGERYKPFYIFFIISNNLKNMKITPITYLHVNLYANPIAYVGSENF